MKKIVQNNLFMITAAWCLILLDQSIISLVVLATLASYTIMELKNKNIWRVITISIISFILSYLLANITVINYIENFRFFLILSSLNIGLLYETLNHLDTKSLYVDTIVITLVFILFICVATILPSECAIGGNRANLYGLILLIFIPCLSVFSKEIVKDIYKKMTLYKAKSIY